MFGSEKTRQQMWKWMKERERARNTEKVNSNANEMGIFSFRKYNFAVFHTTLKVLDVGLK